MYKTYLTYFIKYLKNILEHSKIFNIIIKLLLTITNIITKYANYVIIKYAK